MTQLYKHDLYMYTSSCVNLPRHFGELPGKYIFATREHLIKCLETGVFSTFPVYITRRMSTRVESTATSKVCCDCRMPMLSNSNRVQCTNCRKWH